MRNSENNIRNILYLSILTVIVFFFIASGVSVVFFLHLRRTLENEKTSEGEGSNELTHYQIYQNNPHTNSASFGIISSYESIGEDQFNYIERENGYQILISNIGANEYKCTGRCYCEDDSRRTSFTSSLVSRGISYLLVASSTLVAMNLAKEYFEVECSTELDSCPLGSVRSDIEDCGPLEIVSAGLDNVRKLDDIGGDESRKETYFLCSGHCLTRIFDDEFEYVPNTHPRAFDDKKLREVNQRDDMRLQSVADTMECEKMEYSVRIVVNDIDVKHGELGCSHESRANCEFAKWELNNYCEENSEREVEGMGWTKDIRVLESMCVGHDLGQNPTIKCRMLAGGF